MAPRSLAASLRGPLWLLGLAGLAALVWMAGPLVAIAGRTPLADESARGLAIGLLLAAALARLGGQRLAAARHRRQLLDGLSTGAAPGQSEAQLLRQRFTEADAQLRRLRPASGQRPLGRWWSRRAHLEQLPWYLVIGAPGSGKTTALSNSGLQFPLARGDSALAVQGVGGTRNCDWWLSTEAVLLDTAGRYTTQDSDAQADRAAWFAFLSLLARHRRRRPINGVLVTLSATDLLGASPTRRLAHAAELRERLEELHDRLGIRFPIYVVVTKLDLLAGFVEFFADLDKDERGRVFGFTLPFAPVTDAQAGPPDLQAPLAQMADRLDALLLERLQAEPNRTRRAQLHAFPQQWAQLAPLLQEAVQALAGRLSPPLRPWLRGLYFTSATQEGTPLDRVLGRITRSLGLSAPVMPAARGSGKAFFVARLLREVVFAEAGLAGTGAGGGRWRARGQAGIVALSVVALLLGTLWSWQHHARQRERAQAVATRLPALERDVVRARSAPVTDLAALLPVLDALGAAVAEAPPDGRDMLAVAASDVYLNSLRQAFLPRIAARLEQRLRAGDDTHVNLVYDTLKAYLMLFGGRHYDGPSLRAYLATDWAQTLPGDTTPDQHAALLRHLQQLLDSGEVGSPSTADARLVDQARQRVARVPLAERAYARLQQIDFGPPAALPTVTAPLFVRASGRPPAELPPALYSQRVAREQLEPRVREVLQQFAAEQEWVLGARDPVALDAREAQRVIAEVRQRHQSDHRRRWNEWLADLRLVPAASLADLATQATQLAGSGSPLKAVVDRATAELGADAAAPARAGAPATPRPVALRDTAPAGATSWSTLQAGWAELATQLAAAAEAAARQALPPPSPALATMTAQLPQAPEPLQAWLQPWLQQAARLSLAAVREPLERQLSAEVGAACARVVTGRYPFVRNAQEEASREDWARLFAAGGLLDGFVQRRLAPYVDTAARTWTWRGADAGSASSEALNAFQRSRLLRDVFFQDGGRRLGATLELRLQGLDEGVAEFDLEIDGQLLRFRPGAAAVQRVQWPGTGTTGRVHVNVVPANGPKGPGYTFEGPWALYRLLDRVRTLPGATPDRTALQFDVEGRRARIEVRGIGGDHPWSPRVRQELEQFRCPQRL